MRDPYTVLGVQRKATPADVKSAFRGLAKQYHPDVAGDSDMIASTFQEINAAYDILGDISKRDQFDRGEIDANGMPVMRRQNSRSANARAAHSRGAKPDRKSAADAWAARARAGSSASSNNKRQKNQGEDFKSYSWGRANPKSDSNSNSEAKTKSEEPARRSRADEVFNDLFAGLKAKTQAQRDSQTKPEAEAARKPDPKPEPQVSETSSPGPKDSEETQDSHYNLSISFDESARGTSRRVKLPNGKRLDVKIPAGVTSGQQIRLKGQGKSEAGSGGDAILEINVEPHRHFTCEGDDIYLVLPITIDEAVLGAKVMVPTLDGPVAMTVPPGANADTTLRLKGRGLPRVRGGEEQLYGDQYVTLKIVLPAANDEDFKAAVESWSARNAYDVRSDFMF